MREYHWLGAESFDSAHRTCLMLHGSSLSEGHAGGSFSNRYRFDVGRRSRWAGWPRRIDHPHPRARRGQYELTRPDYLVCSRDVLSYQQNNSTQHDQTI